jgi:DNA-binding NtrC family response regulator
MVMPEGLSGLDLSERLRKDNSKLKVIISRGYTTEITALADSTQTGVVYLAKLFQARALASVVRECLDRN